MKMRRLLPLIVCLLCVTVAQPAVGAPPRGQLRMPSRMASLSPDGVRWGGLVSRARALSFSAPGDPALIDGHGSVATGKAVRIAATIGQIAVARDRMQARLPSGVRAFSQIGYTADFVDDAMQYPYVTHVKMLSLYEEHGMVGSCSGTIVTSPNKSV